MATILAGMFFLSNDLYSALIPDLARMVFNYSVILICGNGFVGQTEPYQLVLGVC